jgi:hypothetical protein
LEFLFKFVVRSQVLYQQLGDTDPASYFQHGMPFETMIGQFFVSISNLMSEKDNNSTLAQGAILKYLPSIIDQLTQVFQPTKLAQLLIDFVANIGFRNSNDERLMDARIQCINKIIQVDTVFQKLN